MSIPLLSSFNQIEDPTTIVESSLGWVMIASIAGLIVLITVALLIFHRLDQKRKAPKSIIKPYQLSDALEDLDSQGQNDQQEPKQQLIEATLILKRFIDQRFQTKLVGMTVQDMKSQISIQPKDGLTQIIQETINLLEPWEFSAYQPERIITPEMNQQIQDSVRKLLKQADSLANGNS